MAKPDKNLEVMLSDGRPVIVCAQYGRKRWSYGVKRNEFMDADFIVDVTRQRSAVPDWLHLRVGPKWGPRFSLAKDEQVGDTDCYVLVIRGTPIVTPKPKPGSFEEIKAYLGKSDLLPRRVEQRSLIIMKDVTEHELTVTKITGFVANPSLPADIFPTGPPKGAKRQ